MLVRVAKNLMVAGVLLAGISSPVLAQKGGQQTSGIGIAVRGGTLGVGVEFSKTLVSHVGLRLGASLLSHDFDGKEQDDITYNIKAKVHAFSALLDLYPGARSPFHVTGGLITNPAKVTAVGLPSGGTFDINDHTYNSADVGSLTGTGEFEKVMPYFGIGFGTAASRNGGLAFVFDFGIAIGKPKIGLSATGAATNASLQNDLNAQIASTQEDLNKVPGYPVLAIGFMYRF